MEPFKQPDNAKKYFLALTGLLVVHLEMILSFYLHCLANKAFEDKCQWIVE